MYMNEQLLQRPVRTMNTSRVSSRSKQISKRMMRRLVALLAIIIIIGVFSLCVSIIAGEQDAYAATGTYQTVEVVNGDTLWSIASQHIVKGQDIREYIDGIKRLNHLKTSTLHEGQMLLLP